MKKPKFSIIIPVYNEEGINSLIKELNDLELIKKAEIIVVDGNKNTTIKKIKFKGIIKIISEKGRAKQMNLGAKNAKGDILIFLHADTKLQKDALTKIEKALEDQSYVAGAFSLRLDSKNLFLKLVSFITSIRSKIVRIPYGDQAIFIRKNYFKKINGFRDIPILEDVELMRSIRKNCNCIKILDEEVISSARRWNEKGIIKTTYTNRKIMFLYMLGFTPEKLVEIYKKRKNN
ncbi:TIGR04283 family arsenosugar biosynthesis glycosyltransferase [Candidatus Woesearchaeota archaeon]|nr:TIGR04283 family arsenosugar biosynthesis glycosyltransferase [Candidatus Woesearchaeota archaeon]